MTSSQPRPAFGASGPSSRSSSLSSHSLGAIESSLRQHEQFQPGEPPSPLRCFLGALTRKKPLDGRTDTSLNRCLNLLDLTSLGEHLVDSPSYFASMH